MDKKTLEFVTYCIVKLSAILNLSQQEVYMKLKNSGILYGYIVPSYDVLFRKWKRNSRAQKYS